MNKRNAILAGTLLLLLGSASHAYGYWVNQLKSDWEIPVSYPVTLSIQMEESETPSKSGIPSESKTPSESDQRTATASEAGRAGQSEETGADG